MAPSSHQSGSGTSARLCIRVPKPDGLGHGVAEEPERRERQQRPRQPVQPVDEAVEPAAAGAGELGAELLDRRRGERPAIASRAARLPTKTSATAADRRADARARPPAPENPADHAHAAVLA